MNHYEFGQTLFFTGGRRTKHTSQDDTSTGMLEIMPDSDGASGVFPWRWGQHNVAKGKIQTQDYPTMAFGESEHAPGTGPNGSKFGPGNWDEYWGVDMSFYESKGLSKTGACPRGQSCGIVFGCQAVVGQNRSFTVAVGPLTLEGPAGTRVVDNFSYWNRSGAVPGAEAAGDLAPCTTKPQPCLKEPKITFCESDPTPGQCEKPMPHKACPPCPKPAPGRKTFAVDPWGKGSSWLTTHPGSPEQPWLKIQCGGAAGDSVTALRPRGATPSLDYQFEAYDYTHLRHQYMVDEDFVVDNEHGASSSGGGYATSEYLDAGIPLSGSFGPVTNTFKPKMNDVVANTSAAGDSHGGYNMTDFGGFTYDTFWTRHMVLLKEGGLIVLDSVTPTALEGGWLGGPHWQFEANCSTTAAAKRCEVKPATGGGGGAWADLTGFRPTTSTWERATGNGPQEFYSLVAKFGAAPDRTHGVADGFMAPPMSLDNCTVPGRRNTRQPCFPAGEWWGFPSQTLYTKQRAMRAGEATVFTSAFIPYLRSETTGAAVEAAVHITQDQAAGSATVKVGPLTITLDNRGAWSVEGR
jgi:hypothetical protein